MRCVRGGWFGLVGAGAVGHVVSGHGFGTRARRGRLRHRVRCLSFARLGCPLTLFARRLCRRTSGSCLKIRCLPSTSTGIRCVLLSPAPLAPPTRSCRFLSSSCSQQAERAKPSRKGKVQPLTIGQKYEIANLELVEVSEEMKQVKEASTQKVQKLRVGSHAPRFASQPGCNHLTHRLRHACIIR